MKKSLSKIAGNVQSGIKLNERMSRQIVEKRQKMENQEVGYTTKDWMLRFVKGMFIGSGFILPGVSGGALAAVFGMYERLISFLAHLTKNFKENVLFFVEMP